MGTSEKRLGFVPLEGLPELSFPQQLSNQDVILRDDDCYALWDRYAMPENIRRHSRFVAKPSLSPKGAGLRRKRQAKYR